MPASSGGLVAIVLAVCLGGGIGGAALAGPPSGAPEAPAPSAGQTSPPRSTPATTAPPVTAPPTQPALAAYVVAANAVCEQSFGKSQAVNLTADQQLANSLATRAQSAALEVTTAEGLLALPLPPDPAVVPLPLALTGYRDAYAAIGAAAKDDGRTVEARGAAVAGVEGAAIQPSAASGAIMQAIGATRCAAWLNPNGLKDTGAN